MSQPGTSPEPPAAPASTTLGEAKKGKVKEKLGGGVLRIVGKVTRRLVWVFSGLIFAGVFVWGLVEIAIYGPSVKIGFAGSTGNFTFDRFLLFAGILSLIPPAIMYLMDSKRRDSIDNNIPHLIRDIADAGRSGMTLVRAIEISAERDYGPLTKRSSV